MKQLLNIGTSIARNSGVLSSMNSGPAISVLGYLPAKSGIATASFRAVFPNDVRDVNALAQGIENCLGNQLQIVPGTIRTLSQNGRILDVVARVTPQRASRFVLDETVTEPAESDEQALTSISGYTAIAKNLYMDSVDQEIWELRAGANGKRMLVRNSTANSDDEIDGVLDGIAVAGVAGYHNLPKQQDRLIDEIHGLCTATEQGTLISYVQPSTRSHRLGFIVSESSNGDSLMVIPTEGSVEEIPLSNVVTAFSLDEYHGNLRQPKVEATAANMTKHKPDASMLISYYRKIYAMNEEFFSNWQRRIRANGML